MTDKPAQSDAPSAEEWWARTYRCNEEFFAYQLDDSQRELIFQFAEAYAVLRTARSDAELRKCQLVLEECRVNLEEWTDDCKTVAAKVAQLERERDTVKLTCVELSIERTDETTRANVAETALSEAIEKIEELTNLIIELITKLREKN